LRRRARKKDVYKSIAEASKDLRLNLHKKLHPRIDLSINLRRESIKSSSHFKSISSLANRIPKVSEESLSSVFKAKIYNSKGVYSTIIPRTKRKRRLTSCVSPEVGDYDINYLVKKPRAAMISNGLISGRFIEQTNKQKLSSSVCERYKRAAKQDVPARKRYISLSNFAKEVGRTSCKVDRKITDDYEEEVIEENKDNVRELSLENVRYEEQVAQIHKLKDNVKASMERLKKYLKESKTQNTKS